jgi:hypothetical protein
MPMCLAFLDTRGKGGSMCVFNFLMVCFKDFRIPSVFPHLFSHSVVISKWAQPFICDLMID